MRVLSFVLSGVISYLVGAPGPVTRAPSALTLDHTPRGEVPQKADVAKKPMGAVMGRSIGSPTDGHLVGGSRLEEAPYLRVTPVYTGQDVRWGLGALVGLIDRSARSVRRQYPDAILSAGHLSRQGGGEIDRHASHESGRDADIGFYVRSQTGKPLYAEHFVAFTADGTAPSWPGAFFDDARNWALVSAIVNDPMTHVSHIFVATPLRARLLAYAERVGAPHDTRVHASELMAQPHGSLPHDDHFHVRIGCPNGMTGCVENPTVPSHRFARVPVPHGRPHPTRPAAPAATPAAHARADAQNPAAPVLAPPQALTPPPAPAPDPDALPDRVDESPAILMDDVDGILR